jgi:enoyl-CoA hydratase
MAVDTPAPTAIADGDDALRLTQPLPGVLQLTLDRPARLNALSRPVVDAINRRLDALRDDASVRVLLLTGTGRAFCAGWDLSSGDGSPPQVTSAYDGQLAFAGMVQRLRALPQTVIAAVNGLAVGAGMGLVLASDLRLAVPAAAFHIGAVRIGLTAGECGISYHLPRLVGAGRAAELMLTGRPLPAEEALQWGLLSALHPAEALLPRALELAALVLRNSPYATQHTKRVFWANLDAPSLEAALELENHAQILALMTDDFHEAQRAFAAKRAPVFTGR